MANLTGYPGAFPFPTSEAVTSPFPIELGARGRDRNGNEYIFCQFSSTVYTGVAVSISKDGTFTASADYTLVRGPVGVACAAATSADGGWVQIYGYTSMQVASGDSAVSSASVAIIATSVTSPATVLDVAAATSNELTAIQGLWVVGSATTDTTSATSHIGVAVPVFLNYPYSVGTFSS